jgi:hypothetical protein
MRRIVLSVSTSGRLARSGLLAAGAAALAATLAGCGGSSGGSGGRAAGKTAAAEHSCAASKHRAGLVVQPSATKTLRRCVGFGTASIAAVELLKHSNVQVQFQDFGKKLGLSACQVAHVPAHYKKCLPAGKPYWAVFVARGGKAWTAPPKGLSSITLHPGDAIGLRYDSPKGKPAPPSASPPASSQR